VLVADRRDVVQDLRVDLPTLGSPAVERRLHLMRIPPKVEDAPSRVERGEGAVRSGVRRSVRGQSLINRLNTQNV
jgi:hypothetical protein